MFEFSSCNISPLTFHANSLGYGKEVEHPLLNLTLTQILIVSQKCSFTSLKCSALWTMHTPSPTISVVLEELLSTNENGTINNLGIDNASFYIKVRYLLCYGFLFLFLFAYSNKTDFSKYKIKVVS